MSVSSVNNWLRFTTINIAACASGQTVPLPNAYTSSVMAEKESTSEQLRREAQKLRETAIDLMEYAARLINKSIDLDNEIAKNAKKTQGLVK
jgi:hypothetical protein